MPVFEFPFNADESTTTRREWWPKIKDLFGQDDNIMEDSGFAVDIYSTYLFSFKYVDPNNPNIVVKVTDSNDDSIPALSEEDTVFPIYVI